MPIINLQAYPTKAHTEYFPKSKKKRSSNQVRFTIICWNHF